MIQFYFLSVLLNVVGGFALCEPSIPKRGPAFEGLRNYFSDRTVRIVLGILTLVTGAFKLLAVVRGDIPVVGDFLPASAGFLVGGALLIEAYRLADAPQEAPESAGDTASKTDPRAFAFGRFVAEHKGAIGVAGIIAGIVHFLFPMVLFL